MNATKKAWIVIFWLIMAGSAPASAWNFDQTRARDIMDRAANDGDETARLLVAMALDDRVDTIFDDYEFKLPANANRSRSHINHLDHEYIYEGLMNGSGEYASKESLMTYALKAHFALWNDRYWIASIYYQTAEHIGEQLIEESGLRPDITVLTFDARAGKTAAMRCNGETPPQDSTYRIDKMLAGLEKTSNIAKNYRAFIQRSSLGKIGMWGLEHSGCWAAPLSGATIIYPIAPFNYNVNASRNSGLVP